MKVFAVYEARWLGLEASPPVQERRWILRGRAHTDVHVGDRLDFAGRTVIIDAISSYGKKTDQLGAMMTGELTVRWEADETELFLGSSGSP